MVYEEHIPLGLLRRLAAGDLTDDELDLVQAWLQSEGLPSPPASVLRRAQRIPRSARPSTLRRVVAMLIGDSGLQPAIAGARGPGTSRYLRYAAGDVELELELSEASGTPGSPGSSRAQAVVGQIASDTQLPRVERSSGHPLRIGGWLAAEMETARGERLETSIDDAGMFAFPPVLLPRTLAIRGETQELVVELPAEEGSDR